MLQNVRLVLSGVFCMISVISIKFAREAAGKLFCELATPCGRAARRTLWIRSMLTFIMDVGPRRSGVRMGMLSYVQCRGGGAAKLSHAGGPASMRTFCAATW